MGPLDSVVRWPVLESLSRVALALAVGLFVGLEREWRGKEAGLRTFGFASLLGALGGLLGPPFALAAVVGTFVLVLILNWSSIGSASGIELTTSAALMVVAFTGVICGQGHRVTPAAVAVITAALLAWKERMATFSHRLTAEELRSAILLGILAFAVYPVLPDHAVDPWGLVIPRAAFVAVLLISALGFVNYVLWKLLGSRGLAATAFLGGLVNSTSRWPSSPSARDKRPKWRSRPSALSPSPHWQCSFETPRSWGSSTCRRSERPGPPSAFSRWERSSRRCGHLAWERAPPRKSSFRCSRHSRSGER
jgi:hypothetical protein